MKALIRADSSIQLGTGHISRCLALGDALRARKHSVTFMCRTLPGDLTHSIEECGYSVCRLPMEGSDTQQTEEAIQRTVGPADWMIVDHYGIDRLWENHQRKQVARLMVIDDLADRAHECDILLDANWHPSTENRYQSLVGAETKLLLGPRYALLKPIFQAALSRRKVRTGAVKHILVFLGGSDPFDFAGRALDALNTVKSEDCRVTVVAGSANPHYDQLFQSGSRVRNVQCVRQVPDMAALIESCDLAIGGGGQASWERVILGLPTLTIPWAENQRPGTGALAKAGVLVELEPKAATVERLGQELDHLIHDSEHREHLSRTALEFSKEYGAEGAKRVVDQLEAFSS